MTPRLMAQNSLGNAQGIERGYDNFFDDASSTGDFLKPNRDTLKLFTGVEDIKDAPMEKKELRLPWWYFNTDFYSTDRNYSEVADICLKFHDKIVDLRPYMIRYPYSVQSTDNLNKCLELFRHMHLRALPVISPHNGKLEGIITRQDIFAHMSL